MIELLEDESAIREIAAEWDRQVLARSDVPDGLGPTSLCEVALLIRAILAPDARLHVLSARDNAALTAVLPAYIENRRLWPFRYRHAGLMPDLYPGRTGLIGTEPATENTLDALLEGYKRWDMAEFHCLAGSAFEQQLASKLRAANFSAVQIGSVVYPYIRLPQSWDDLQTSFTKKFRYNLRSREKKLRAVGTVEARCYSEASQLDEFFSHVKDIEKNSWKESAGTSLTANQHQQQLHEKLAPIAADRGGLRSYVLLLNDKPIAHIIGLYFNATFHCLKSSFDNEFRNLAPGITLKALVMQELIDVGARYWDFVGPAEDHKRQWSKESYTLNQYVVFAPTFKGTLLQMRRSLTQIARSGRGQHGTETTDSSD